uniref:Putative portal protein n=1 Tax=viral metagenome TaxID=1070528 RepID=A0A6M3XJU6_9ZZZZ
MFKGLSKEKKLKRVKHLFREAVVADTNFQKEAKEDFKFRDGNQWTKEEKQILEEELRPCLTFNLVKRFVDLVMGLNEDYRVRYVASPVETTDGFLAEVLNDLSRWVENRYGFDDEKDVTKEAATISGRGYCAIDFVPDTKNIPRGFIKVFLNNIPVYECRKDPTSRKNDLSDAGYIFWDKWLSLEDFRVTYPKYAEKAEEFLESGKWFEPATALSQQEIFEPETDDNEDDDYSRSLDTTYWDRGRKMTRVVHMEYWQAYKRYYGFNPQSGEVEEFEEESLEKLKAVFPRVFGAEFDYFTVWDKKVQWLQFLGEDILYDGDSPIPSDDFSITPCFAFSDLSGRTGDHYGLVRLMKDPQKEVNRRWSQTLNLLNQQVQPGVFAEADTFVDDETAMASLKEPGSVTLLKKGGLASLKEREMPRMPTAILQMEEMSQNIMLKITGINPDLLGMDRGRQEPGIVVRARQQQGLILLKPLFKAYARLDRGIFERLLSIITEYMPDEQVVEILGQNERYAIKDGMIIDKKTNITAELRSLRKLRYNIETEQVPGNRTHRMMMLSILLEMMQTGFPVDPAQVIEKLELPESEKQRWYQHIAQVQQMQAEAAKREQDLKLAEIQAKNQVEMKKLETDSVIKIAKVREQKIKDEEKRKGESDRLTLDDARTQLDFIVRDKQADAQMLNAKANIKRDKTAQDGRK